MKKLGRKYVIVPVLCLTVTLLSCFPAMMLAGSLNGSLFGIVNMKKADSAIEKYISSGEYDKAAAYCAKVQKAYSNDENVLMYLLDKISSVAPNEAYELVENYCSIVPEGSRSDSVNNIIELANSEPIQPEASPEADTYMDYPTVSFGFADKRIGHSIYYTLNGKDPTEKSQLYTSPFKLEGNTEIKVIVLNSKGDKSPIYSYKYRVSQAERQNFEAVLGNAKAVFDKAVVGNEKGQCTKEQKDELEQSLKLAESVLKDGSSTSVKLAQVYIRDLQDRIDALNNSVVTSSKIAELSTKISDAEKLISSISDADKESFYDDVAQLEKYIQRGKDIVENSRNTDSEVVEYLLDDLDDSIEDVKKDIEDAQYSAKSNALIGTYSSAQSSSASATVKIEDVDDDGLEGNVNFNASYTANNGSSSITYNISGKTSFDDLRINGDNNITLDGTRTVLGATGDVSEPINSDYSINAALSIDADKKEITLKLDDPNIKNSELKLNRSAN